MARKPALLQVEYIPIDQIVVNHDYQRTLKPAHVKQIEDAFHQGLLDPVRVWKKDENLYQAWDGQHTIEMLKARGWKAAPCFVLNGATTEKELAHLFVLRQVLRKPLRPLEVYKAELYAGSPRAVAIEKIVGEYGLRIAAGVPNGIAAIKKVERVFDAGPAALRNVLTVITRSWEDDRDRLHGNIILGLHNYLLHEKPESVSMEVFIDRLVAKLTRISPVEILRKAHATAAHEGGGNIMATAVENEIRKSVRRRRI